MALIAVFLKICGDRGHLMTGKDREKLSLKDGNAFGRINIASAIYRG